MALVTPDFTEVQEDIGSGEYMVRITGAENGVWEKSGTPYVKWTLETINEEEPKNNGRKVWDNTPVAGKGAFRLQRLYKAAVGESLAGEFDTEQLIGRELAIVVKESDRGYPEVASYKGIQ